MYFCYWMQSRGALWTFLPLRGRDDECRVIGIDYLLCLVFFSTRTCMHVSSARADYVPALYHLIS